MNKPLKIGLNASLFGFVGKAAGQPAFEDPELDNVYLIGGSYQLWIPNLEPRHVRELD